MYIDLGTLTALALLLLLVGTAWFWNGSLRARDTVIRACMRLCRDVGVQFLDETVALSGLGLRRDLTGRLRLRRRYKFEYSGTGNDRWPGHALLTGLEIDTVQLQGPDGITILDPARPARIMTVEPLPPPPPGNRQQRLH